MPRDRKLHDEEADYLGPVAIAMFVDVGWIRGWPMSWSRNGLRALQNGYGRWQGQQQRLPVHLEGRADGAAHWDGRRPRVPVGTNIPLAE